MEKKRNILEGKLQPPVGSSDWAEFSQKSYCVDKTLLIKELVDRNTKVALFTRPRRFGKTTAMQMLQAFFEKTGEDTSYLFDKRKIWSAGEKYREKQGKYPVIFLSFRDFKPDNWKDACEDLATIISDEVVRHRDAVHSDWSAGATKNQLLRVFEGTGTLGDLRAVLKQLSLALHVYHGVKPVILIDEYDQPISCASTGGFYDKMVAFMCAFLSCAMKDNAHCEMGIMTGVLRVAKEGILSGLNNLSVWTVFNNEFSEYFGFTESEVEEMCRYYDVPEKLVEIKEWYDGYNFGGTEIYNPWSVNEYFARSCEAGEYWVSTSSNGIISEIIEAYPYKFAEVFEKFIRNRCEKFPKGEEKGVIVPMAKELGPYREVLNSSDTLYALLVSAGYLKVLPDAENDDTCAVRIPNRELLQVFVREIKRKLNRSLTGGISDIGVAIRENSMTALRKSIASFLRESVSYFDTASESFFHGLTLGFLATLRDRYRVESNGESGDGRFDIALTPLLPAYPGFVIEVKAADNDADDLKALAQSAIDQIVAKDYFAKIECAMKALKSSQPVVKIGLAYFKKRVELVQS